MNWYRPVSLAVSVQYYMQLLQQTAFAICSYDILRNNNNECKLLPDWDASLQRLGEHISDVMAEVNSDFWNGMGADMVPRFIDEHMVSHHDGEYDGAKAIRDAVRQEVDAFFKGDDASFSMNML